MVAGMKHIIACAAAVLSPVIVILLVFGVLRHGSSTPAEKPTSAPAVQTREDAFVENPQPWHPLASAELSNSGSLRILDPFTKGAAHSWRVIGPEFTGAAAPALLATTDDGQASLLIERRARKDVALTLLVRDAIADWPWAGWTRSPNDKASRSTWATVTVDGGIPLSREATAESRLLHLAGDRLAVVSGAPMLDLHIPPDGCKADFKPCKVPFEAAVLCGSQAMVVNVGLRLSSRAFSFDLRNAPPTAMAELLPPGQRCP
jgi:hypothetical protein